MRGRAVEAYTIACDAGSNVGCDEAANWLRQWMRYPAALAVQRTACTRGALDACVSVAEMLGPTAAIPGQPARPFSGVDPDPAEAHALRVRACEGGEPVGCLSLAYASRDAVGVARDPSAVRLALRRACEAPGVDVAALRRTAETEGAPGASELADEGHRARREARGRLGAISSACSQLSTDLAAGRYGPVDHEAQGEALRRGCDASVPSGGRTPVLCTMLQQFGRDGGVAGPAPASVDAGAARSR